MDDAFRDSNVECPSSASQFLLRTCRIAFGKGITESSDCSLQRGTNSLVSFSCFRIGLDPLYLRLDICHERTSRRCSGCLSKSEGGGYQQAEGAFKLKKASVRPCAMRCSGQAISPISHKRLWQGPFARLHSEHGLRHL